jgi:hypothetical protein
MDAPLSTRQRYAEWVEDQVEDYKSALSREDLLGLAEEAVEGLFDTDDGQYPLTEILLRDAVDALIFQRLRLPGYRQWLKTCHNDTDECPDPETGDIRSDGEEVA